MIAIFKETTVEVQTTKRKRKKIKVNPTDVERQVREHLARKVSGSMAGLWLVGAELHRLQAWDLIKTWTGGYDRSIAPRLGLQLVHEAALCTNRLRRKENIAHQGFELLNGLPWMASDEQMHRLLNNHTVKEACQLQQQLLRLRANAGHFHDDNIWAIDPHRLKSTTQRITPKKKKHSGTPADKTFQTFFALDVNTGQPLIFDVGTAGKTATTATFSMMKALQNAMPRVNKNTPALLVADSEHYAAELLDQIADHPCFDIILST